MSTEFIVVMTACPSNEEADRLATALIERRFAACVQSNAITSIYHWKGAVDRTDEVRLLIKTTAAHFESISDLIRETLSYENPEILSLPVLQGSPDYLAWISSETGPHT